MDLDQEAGARSPWQRHRRARGGRGRSERARGRDSELSFVLRCPFAFPEDEDEGFSGHALSQGGSFRGGGAASSQDAAPGIGFASGSEWGPSGPPSNPGNVYIPPGAHAPANTPAGRRRSPPRPRRQRLGPSRPSCDPADSVKPVPMPRTAAAVDPDLSSGQQQGQLGRAPQIPTSASQTADKRAFPSPFCA